jgi:hypothetical protein
MAKTKTAQTITLPVLVMTNDLQAYKYFVISAGFDQEETKIIKGFHNIKGYKDTTLMILRYVPGYQDILDYAKGHNIRAVKAYG